MDIDTLNDMINTSINKGLIKSGMKSFAEKSDKDDEEKASRIEKLYNTKSKDIKYKKNISELAYPEPVVLLPSYNKINGLIENPNEAQSIIINIINKHPSGQLDDFRYAKQNLALSLVRLGNYLDNIQNYKLRELSDKCLENVTSEKINKTATPIVAAIAGVAIILGGIYIQQNMPFTNEGFEKNHEKLIAEIDDILDSADSFQTMIGFGQEYTNNFLAQMQTLKNKLNSFYNEYQKNIKVIIELDRPKDAKELIESAKAGLANEIKKSKDSLYKELESLIYYLNETQRNFKSQSYKLRQVKEKGMFQSLIDKMKVLHGRFSLIADDFDDIVRAISPYMTSVIDIMNILKQSEEYEKSVNNKIQETTLQLEDISKENSKKQSPETSPETSPLDLLKMFSE